MGFNSGFKGLTSTLYGAVTATPQPLQPRERPGKGGWVGPVVAVDGFERSRPHPPTGFDPRTVQHAAVAIPTELSRRTPKTTEYENILWIAGEWISASRSYTPLTVVGEPTEKINKRAKTSAEMQALFFRNRPHSTLTHTQEI